MAEANEIADRRRDRTLSAGLGVCLGSDEEVKSRLMRSNQLLLFLFSLSMSPTEGASERHRLLHCTTL
jgi:hypothetical protein